MKSNKQESRKCKYRFFIIDKKVDLVNETKHLGVMINRKLKFDLNVNYVRKKIKIISRLRNYLYKKQENLFITSIVLPHFMYASVIWYMVKKKKHGN